MFLRTEGVDRRLLIAGEFSEIVVRCEPAGGHVLVGENEFGFSDDETRGRGAFPDRQVTPVVVVEREPAIKRIADLHEGGKQAVLCLDDFLIHRLAGCLIEQPPAHFDVDHRICIFLADVLRRHSQAAERRLHGVIGGFADFRGLFRDLRRRNRKRVPVEPISDDSKHGDQGGERAHPGAACRFALLRKHVQHGILADADLGGDCPGRSRRIHVLGVFKGDGLCASPMGRRRHWRSRG